ncbi:ATP-binding protein [Streptomyces sp. ODS05-4]|uniref:ATP-binding protein n=1 Tax=Streptomyces sp. ODS05-4 TaxID=2944939 RepID=UPI00210D80AA|nr:ATP-binding protein [Streptomyces sp. ODS05-4]
MTTRRTATDRHTPANAAAARDRVRGLLAAADLPSAVVNDVLLVTSELVTNALRHGGGLTAFDAALTGDAVVISVTDPSPHPPRSGGGSVTTPGGFGWPLVQRLSREVGVEPAGPGKTITAVVALGDAPAPPDAG